MYGINPAQLQERLHSLFSLCLHSDPGDHWFKTVGCGGAVSPGCLYPSLLGNEGSWVPPGHTTSAPARPTPLLRSPQMVRGRHRRAEANKFLCSRSPRVMTLWSSHSCSSPFCGITHAAASFWGNFWCQASPFALLSVTYNQNILPPPPEEPTNS